MNSNLFYRSNPLVTRRKGGGLTLSFSSEVPVKRWFGQEILLHGNDNVDLSRLQSVGSLIYGHDPAKLENVLGRINRVWIENRKGYAEITMDKDGPGKIALQKVQSGSIRGVSVGYQINEARQLEDKETWTDPDSGQSFDGPAMVATQWTPYEISLTPIPADPSVGIGRDLTRSLDGIRIINNTIQKEITRMEIDRIANPIVSKIRDTEAARNDLIGRARMISPEAAAYAENALREGKSMEEIQSKLLDMAGVIPNAGTAHRGAILRSFKQISDEQFFAGLSNPSAIRVDDAPLHSSPVKTRQGHSSGVTFRQISDDDFFASLSDPAQYRMEG